MGAWRKKSANLVKFLSARRKLLIRVAIILAALLGTITILYQFNWSGFGKDSNKSVTTEYEANPITKEVIKITHKETENFQSSKTLWDWLQLGGAIAIPFALLYFQRAEQRRSDKRAQEEKEIAEEQAKREKEIANNNLREQALEAYIDRMSELLIDKNLKVLIGKKLKESNPEYPVLDAGCDIARARTLSVLRRLDQDGERKGSVIRFLIDAELISNLYLNGANLSRAILTDANLEGAKLHGANLEGAKLGDANLREARLGDAILTSANLGGANLIYANLGGANLGGANLREANLGDANLREARLGDAILTGANLFRANLEDANLEGANLGGANLIRATLTGAILTGANLFRANLEGAILTGANLGGAILTGANLGGAYLGGVHLNSAENLTPEQVKQAENWEKAKYSEEFRAALGLPPEPTE